MPLDRSHSWVQPQHASWTRRERHTSWIHSPLILARLQFWFDQAIRTPSQAAQVVQTQYQVFQAMAPGRVVVVKEAWWPSAVVPPTADPAATEENQAEFFRELAASPVKFVWGEAYDQFWKQEPLGQGPNWGLHRVDGSPKWIVGELSAIYRGSSY